MKQKEEGQMDEKKNVKKYVKQEKFDVIKQENQDRRGSGEKIKE